MDNKNVFIAIALSMSVLLFWAAFFPPPEPTKKNVTTELKEKNNLVENNILPNINETVEDKSISREQSIAKNKRIKIENNNIQGTLLLKGGVIDDVSFKSHKKDIKSGENVVLLNPKDTRDGYFIETGWTSIGNKIEVPNLNSKWSLVGNNILTPNNPIILEWKNKNGIIFRKKIEIDEKYLFNITQEIQNNSKYTNFGISIFYGAFRFYCLEIC